MRLPHARHGHAGSSGAGFPANLDKKPLQVLVHRQGALAQNVANVLAGLALDHPFSTSASLAVSLNEGSIGLHRAGWRA